MLYKVLQRMIARGDTDGLQEKIDVLYAIGRLAEDEYQTLIAML